MPLGRARGLRKSTISAGVVHPYRLAINALRSEDQMSDHSTNSL
jgi:hypothetical protein